MKKPDAGNPLVRFDEGWGITVIGYKASHPVFPAYSTASGYDIYEISRKDCRVLGVTPTKFVRIGRMLNSFDNWQTY